VSLSLSLFLANSRSSNTRFGRLIDLEYKILGKSGAKIPVLGMGTWGIGGLSNRNCRGDDQAVKALRLGLDLEMRFIDTAEMYARGHSEEVVAKAVGPERESVFIASKVSAENLSYERVLRSCEASLRRLETGYIDLYQVHWPNPSIPIAETMRAMEKLFAEGKVHHIGVSNFSVRQTHEAQKALSKADLASNQVEYSLVDRSIEEDLLPFATDEHITIIAYSPVGRGQLAEGGRGGRWEVLELLARRYGRTEVQVALNWLIVKGPVVAIPKAVNLDHVKENAGAAGWKLNREDEAALNSAFQ
jgi:diketogulonate reductase-like aldo/keto reductase